jgi:hypothetical protein
LKAPPPRKMVFTLTVRLDPRKRPCLGLFRFGGDYAVEVVGPELEELRGSLWDLLPKALAALLAWGPAASFCDPVCGLEAAHHPEPRLDDTVDFELVIKQAWNEAFAAACEGGGSERRPSGAPKRAWGGAPGPAPPGPAPRHRPPDEGEAERHAERIRNHIARYGCAPNFADPEKRAASERYVRSAGNLQTADVGLVDAIVRILAGAS